MKFSHKLNGYTSINVTKLDVLSGLKKLKIATHYELNGRKLDGLMPANIEDLGKCTIHTVEMDGWSEDISQCKSREELPRAAQDYLHVIEKELAVPVSWVGTGPEREAMFLCQ